MEKLDINKLLSIDHMKAFSQTAGICWLFVFISILFFDDINQRSTLKLFKWIKTADKIIPISSVYKNTGNKKLDDFMYTFLEVIRLNIKSAIFGHISFDQISKCNNMLVNIFDDYERGNVGVFDNDEIFSYEKDNERGDRKIKVFTQHSGFFILFCKYYDIIANINKIDNNQSLFKIAYYVKQHGFGDIGHATSIFTHGGVHYYYDSNISSGDISKCEINSTKNPTLKNVLKSCEISEKNPHGTLAYKYKHLRPSELNVAEHACIKNLLSESTFIDGMKCVLDRDDGSILLYGLFIETYHEFLDACLNYRRSSLLSMMHIYDGFMQFVKMFMNNVLDTKEILMLCTNKFIRNTTDAKILVEQYADRSLVSDDFYSNFYWFFDYLYNDGGEHVINDIIIRSLYKTIKEYTETYTFSEHDTVFINYFKTLYNTTFIEIANAYKPKSGAKLLSDNSIVFSVILRSDSVKTVDVTEYSLADASTYESEYMMEHLRDDPNLEKIQKLNVVMTGGYIVNRFKPTRFG
jgi:hypothetical protein